MKAVILCDDSMFASKARVLLRRVGDRPGVSVRWTIKAWPVNALHHASLSETALLSAKDAHLVVFPKNHACSPSPHLKGWLNRWAALRDFEDAAVGIIGDAGDAGEADEISLELRLLLQRHGLNLIHDESEATLSAAKLEVRFPRQPEQTLPILLAHLSPGMADAFRGFGINE